MATPISAVLRLARSANVKLLVKPTSGMAAMANSSRCNSSRQPARSRRSARLQKIEVKVFTVRIWAKQCLALPLLAPGLIVLDAHVLAALRRFDDGEGDGERAHAVLCRGHRLHFAVAVVLDVAVYRRR